MKGIENNIEKTLDIQKIVRNDPSEMAKLAMKVAVWVYNVVLSYVQNQEDAEEIVQDTLIAAVNGLDKFRNESSLRTWVYKIAINKSKDLIKYRERQKRSASLVSLSQKDINDRAIYEPLNFIHPGVELESKEELVRLFAAINRLKDSQKEVLILAKLEQMSMNQVADVMNITVKAAEGLLARARKSLRTDLEKWRNH